jgi:hypothetical protein
MYEQMENQQQELKKVKKEKEDEENKRMVGDEKQKRINLENQKLKKQMK